MTDGPRSRLGDAGPAAAPASAARRPAGRLPRRAGRPALADQALRGFLTGSIDAVLRVADPDGEPRYLVVDYKTNWLGPLDGAPLTSADYTPAADGRGDDAPRTTRCRPCSTRSRVHRLLRWRQPGYDPERHLGGVLYLFVRGMAGPGHPGGRRRAVRRLQLAAAGGAGGRAVRPAGRGPPVSGQPPSTGRRRRAAGRTSRPGCWPTFNAAGVLVPADVHTARSRRPDRPARPTSGCCWRWPWPSARCATGSVCIDLPTVAETVFDEAEEGVDLLELPWPEPDGVAARPARPAALVAAGAGRGRPAVRCGWPTGCSTWSATGSRRSRSVGSSQHRCAADPPAVDRDRLAAALDRLFPATGWTRRAGPAAARRSGQRAAAGSACWPAGRAPARPPRSPGCWRCSRDQPGRPPRIALAAPTGKAAARLEEAVPAAAARAAGRRTRRGSAISARRPCTGCSAGCRQPGPVPARRRQPAAARRRGGRRDVDGLADPDGPAARGGPARRARLVLVGDPDQLSSVEAGAVLADIAGRAGSAGRGAGRAGWPSSGRRPRPRLPPVHGVVQLTTPGGSAARSTTLARAIRAADADAVMAVLRSGATDVRFVEVDLEAGPARGARRPRELAEQVAAAGAATLAAAAGGRRRRRPGRAGPAPAAVRPPARAVRGRPVEPGGRALAGRGRPGLRRGRRVVPRPAAAGHGQRLRAGPLQRRHRRDRRHAGDGVRAAFARGGRSRRCIAPVRLDAVQTVHAMTVHRAQGSQFERRLVPGAAAGLAAADPRAALHRGHPGDRAGAGHRRRGGRPAGGPAAGQPGQRPARTAGLTSTWPRCRRRPSGPRRRRSGRRRP